MTHTQERHESHAKALGSLPGRPVLWCLTVPSRHSFTATVRELLLGTNHAACGSLLVWVNAVEMARLHFLPGLCHSDTVQLRCSGEKKRSQDSTQSVRVSKYTSR